jgi:hypothetical protein
MLTQSVLGEDPDKSNAMKRKVWSICMLLCSIAVLSACSSTNNLSVNREDFVNAAKENKLDCFVQKTDGSMQYFNSLVLVTGIFTTPYLLADGKIKIPAATIRAYQNADHYAVSEACLQSVRKSRVAVEALPGFAVRITKGNLNIYCKKYFNGAKAVDEIYIQLGEDGKIQPYSASLIAGLISSDAAALALLNDKTVIKSLTKRVQAVAELYNRSQLISKN